MRGCQRVGIQLRVSAGKQNNKGEKKAGNNPLHRGVNLNNANFTDKNLQDIGH